MMEYYRKAKLKSIVDGDTVRLLVDLGYRTFCEQSIRLAGVNAPKIYRVEQEEKEQGQITKDYVTKWFEKHYKCSNEKWPYIVHSISSDSFGRYLGIIYCLRDHNLNEDLLMSGYAKPFKKAE